MSGPRGFACDRRRVAAPGASLDCRGCRLLTQSRPRGISRRQHPHRAGDFPCRPSGRRHEQHRRVSRHSPCHGFPHPRTPHRHSHLLRLAHSHRLDRAGESQHQTSAGGRERVFGENQKQLFESGINAVVLGDYLTTKGNTPKEEVERIQSYGYGIATNCEE